jgi:leucine dehydrogenase
MRVEDINHIAHNTSHVVGGTSSKEGSGDPSPFTALGVFEGIKASLNFRRNDDSLKDLKISIQGCGAVGEKLARLLHKEGAHLILGDINSLKAETLAKELNAECCDPNEIHKVPVDVFAPCALGGILNKKSINELQTEIVAGGANNQLLNEDEDGKDLQQRNILYAPDYVINAGGLISVYREVKGYSEEKAFEKTKNIYQTLTEVFQKAKDDHIPTYQASNILAEEKLKKR